MGKMVGKSQCPQCGDAGDGAKDNLVSYEDGSAYCFACDYTIPSNGVPKDMVSTGKKFSGAVLDLVDRKILKSTCEKYGVETVNFNGVRNNIHYTDEKAVMYPIYSGGELIDQKMRLVRDKNIQFWAMKSKTDLLFGMHAFNPTKNICVIVTEGEFDAMCIYQATGFPAVSVTKGANGAAKQLAANLQWLDQWKDVVLCFDMDEPGQKAVAESIPVFDVGRVRVAHLPEKDANDMILSGRGNELKKLIWDAESVKPTSIVGVKDIRDLILQKPKAGMDWPWQPMTDATFGFRTGEIYVLAAAEGVGKTEVVKELIFHSIENDIPVGVFSLEQRPDDTIRRLIGGRVNKRLHIPTETWWDQEVIDREIEYLNDKVFLYNTYNSNLSFENIVSNIKYLAKCHKTKLIVIDNLTALCLNAKIDGRSVRDSEYVGHVMNTFFSIIKELDITLLVVSHLATDKMGMSTYVSMSAKSKEALDMLDNAEAVDKHLNKPGLAWESGRVPRLENIYGSGTVRKLADFIMVLSRNRTSPDYNEHRELKVKFLKTRIDSSNEGKSFSLYYNYNTGRLEL